MTTPESSFEGIDFLQSYQHQVPYSIIDMATTDPEECAGLLLEDGSFTYEPGSIHIGTHSHTGIPACITLYGETSLITGYGDRTWRTEITVRRPGFISLAIKRAQKKPATATVEVYHFTIPENE